VSGESSSARVSSVPTSIADWAAIYAENGGAIRAAALAAIGGPDKEILGKSADDIVGDLIVEFMVNGTDLSQKSDLRGYLTAAVRNRVRDLHRRSKFERPEALDPDDVVGHEDIEDAVDRDELASQATAALDQLPERERYAIVERVMKCRPAQEVGPELDVRPQRVSQLVNAGLGRLRKLPAFTELLSVDPSPPGPSAATGSDATGTPS
jgi:RNA polymerase sigma factor (sigma-70 family)